MFLADSDFSSGLATSKAMVSGIVIRFIRVTKRTKALLYNSSIQYVCFNQEIKVKNTSRKRGFLEGSPV